MIYRLVILLFFYSVGFGQGLPPIKNYLPQEYNGHRQNWAVAQDNNGIIYVANGKGLLSYDGVDWSLIMMPNKGHVRSLVVHNNKVYVGANNDFGELMQLNNQEIVFKSFLDSVPIEQKNFGRIWSTVVVNDEVYYQSYHRLFKKMASGSIKSYPFEQTVLHRVFVINNELYALDIRKGMYKMGDDDELHLIENGAKFIGVRSSFLVPLSGNWLVEKDDELLLFDGEDFRSFQTEMAAYFKKYGIRSCLMSKNGHLIVGTEADGGFAVLNTDGSLISIVDDKSGLSSANILGLFEDQQGGIWTGLQEGLSRVDINSSISFFNDQVGLEGTVQDLAIFDGKLYVGTSEGLAVQNEQGRFSDIDATKSYIWQLLSLSDKLLIASSNGVYYLHNSKVKTVAEGYLASSILSAAKEYEGIFVTSDTGFGQYRWDGENWQRLGAISTMFGSVRDIVEIEPGVFWLKTRSNGLYKVVGDYDKNGAFDFDNYEIQHYLSEKGVPVGENNIFSLNNQLYLRSETDSVYRYEKETDSFQSYNRLNEDFSLQNGYAFPKLNLNDNQIWLELVRDNLHQLVRCQLNPGGNYEKQYYPLTQGMRDYQDPFSNEVFFASDRYAWFSGMKGILQYNLVSKQESLKPVFNVYITQVRSGDSILYRKYDKDIEPLKLPYDKNDLVIHYASPYSNLTGEMQYQYYLDGFDGEWSDSGPQAVKEYTNLPWGDYTFNVRAINDDGETSDIATLSVTIKNPWYWNGVAVTIYVIVVVYIIYLISIIKSRALKRRNKELETAIADGVKETKRQADEIKELYNVKNQFFANISHELRTPLTLILGPAKDLSEDNELEVQKRNKLHFIHNNAQRLLKLINQLLDLSKLEGGQLKLKVRQNNLVRLIATITASFDSMASEKGVKLSFSSHEDEYYVFYDEDKMEQIVINLLSNALKFTRQGDEISVTIIRKMDDCLIQIKDSGIGISEDQLPYIFDRFYQADDSQSREHEGTGIGLSLTKELVELHGGTINVESTKAVGTVFEVSFPFGKSHFSLDQLRDIGINVSKELEVNEKHRIQEEDLLHDDESEVILLVEDNMEMRAYIKSMLTDYAILEAENGEIGLEIAIEKIPDLIISDVMMPKLDGTELCKRIKAHDLTAHIPIVLLTAKASEQDKIKGLEIQADDYLAKPFNKDELLARIKNLILSRRKLQKRFAQSVLISPKEIAVTSMEQNFLESLVEFIEEHIGNERFGVEQLADSMNLSRSQLHRKVVAITDNPPSVFIRKYRLQRAKQLLEKGAGRVSDIAFQVGFSSASYFTKCFTEEFGKAPKEVIKD